LQASGPLPLRFELDSNMTARVHRIEPATSTDVPRLVALLGELFAIEHDFSVDPNRQRRGLQLLLERPEHAVVLAARAGSNAVGMISAQLVISTAEGAPSVWIEDVVVDPLHRRIGVGQALVTAALAWGRGRGATRAQLLVDGTNNAALAFYEKLGWQSTQLSARRVFLQQN
jgi:ribosomal protein S18 acetylase RimI-like enzyme